MSERRLYVDPDDEYQTEVLAPAVKEGAVGPAVVMGLEHASSEGGIEPHETPVLIYLEGGEIVERFGEGEIPLDEATHVTLADEYGMLDEDRVMRPSSTDREADSA